MNRHVARGFTLVELLVVVAIIVVLLALLIPAMDKAIYQSELAVCATRQRGLARGVTQYAMENKRQYPQRDSYPIGVWHRPNLLKYRERADDLSRTRAYIPLQTWLDPLNGGLRRDDLDPAVGLHADTSLYANYMLWSAWRNSSVDGGAGSNRLGQGFEWLGRRYHLLVSDEILTTNFLHVENGHAGKNGGGRHSEGRNAGQNVESVQEKTTRSLWLAVNSDVVDSQFTGEDGAVQRVVDVTGNDGRLDHIPFSSDHASNWTAVGSHTYAPRE